MAKQYENEAYIKELSLRTKSLCTASDRFIDGLALNTHSGRTSLIKDVVGEVERLSLLVTPANRPPWFSKLAADVARYSEPAVERDLTPRLPELVENIAAATAIAKSFQWRTEDVAGGVNFDEIYETYRSKSRIDELVDQLIATLQKIAALPDCDSAKLQAHLAEIIATLKRSKGASWTGAVSAWKMTEIFLKHLSFNVVKKVTGADVLMDTAQATLTEIAAEAAKVQQSAGTATLRLVDQQIEKLPPSLRWMDEAQRQSVLPAPQPGEAGVIDVEFEKK